MFCWRIWVNHLRKHCSNRKKNIKKYLAVYSLPRISKWPSLEIWATSVNSHAWSHTPSFSHFNVWQNTDLYLGRSDVKQRGAAPVGIVRFIILVKVIIRFQISERPRGVRRLRGWGQGFGAFDLHLTASVLKTTLLRCSWLLTFAPTTKSTLRRSHRSLQINSTPIIVQRPLFY